MSPKRPQCDVDADRTTRRWCRAGAWRFLLLGMVCVKLPVIAALPDEETGQRSAPVAMAADFAPANLDAVGSAEEQFVVRLYYRDRAQLDDWAGEFDLFEYADHEAGYVLARLSAGEWGSALAAGARVELDETRTDSLRRVGLAGINRYPCYRTVEETEATIEQLAAAHPDIARVTTIGTSWERVQHGPGAGYDLKVLTLTSAARPGPKPRLFIMAEHHARELATAETALRFAEELVAGYGVDPDITWMLDYGEVHVLPMANPDGRKWAEQGEWWRKNTDNTNRCALWPNYGTDLNRNCGYRWGLAGSSGTPCSDTYRGPAPFSEPENQAIRDYVRTLFPSQRGPGDNDPAPVTASGLVISLHSYAQLVLYPWGWTSAASPNAPDLHALGLKFGFFNRYTVQPAYALYATSGTVDDWAYGELGVASYTFEIGTDFFEPCANFAANVYPANRDALFFACKASRQPYLAPAGPDVIQVKAVEPTNQIGVPVTITASALTGRVYGSNPLPPNLTLGAARYSIDQPSWIEGTRLRSMTVVDGVFDETFEYLTATIDTGSLAPGRHTVFVEAQNAEGRWGVPTGTFFWVEPLAVTGSMTSEGFVLEWPGAASQFYRVWRAEGPGEAFTPFTGLLPGKFPRNRVVDPDRSVRARFYRVELELPPGTGYGQ